MGYERFSGGGDPRSDGQDFDYGQDYGSGRDYTYSSARNYAAAGRYGGDRDDRSGRYDQGQQRGYGRQEYGNQRYEQREQFGRGQYDRGHNDRGQGDRGQGDRGQGGYGRQEQGWRGGQYGGSEYHGSYASDGRRFEDVGRYRHADDDNYRGREQSRDRGGYGRQPQGYDYEERGFFQRAGDEVRSWFGDDEAERRRERDARYDERAYGGNRHDEDYHSWRSSQIASLDRDYDEYRQENRSRFQNEFATWRTNRQGQRDLLKKVEEHQDVVGSDGEHVGTVDKVRGDRILLTKNDADAGGRHHSIPSRWISAADGKVTLSKTADEAKAAWRDEERNSALFNYGDNSRDDDRKRDDNRSGQAGDGSSTNLNRSFSGTY